MRKEKQIQLSDHDMSQLRAYIISQTESSSKVQRSRIIVDYSTGMTIAKIVCKYGTNRTLVERTIDKTI